MKKSLEDLNLTTQTHVLELHRRRDNSRVNTDFESDFWKLPVEVRAMLAPLYFKYKVYPAEGQVGVTAESTWRDSEEDAFEELISEVKAKLKRCAYCGAAGAHILGIAMEVGYDSRGKMAEVSQITAYFCSEECKEKRAPKRIE